MDHQAKKKPGSLRFLPFMILLTTIICGLYVWVAQTFRPLYDFSREASIPFSINATRTADYSPDTYAPLANVSLSIILDLIQDLDPASASENRIATLVVSLQTPVSTVTPLPGSTQPGFTPPATPIVGTPVAETAVTESPVVIIPNTPIPATPSPVPPSPPPPPRPTRTIIVVPPTIVPSATPTVTYSPTPEPAHLAFTNPSSDGMIVASNIDTNFEIEAWDPAVGSNNGDGITSITFSWSSMGADSPARKNT